MQVGVDGFFGKLLKFSMPPGEYPVDWVEWGYNTLAIYLAIKESRMRLGNFSKNGQSWRMI
jgi:hypothetical protein